MSDQVVNPEDRFSHNEAQFQMFRWMKLGAVVLAAPTMTVTFWDCVGSIAKVEGPSMQVSRHGAN